MNKFWGKVRIDNLPKDTWSSGPQQIRGRTVDMIKPEYAPILTHTFLPVETEYISRWIRGKLFYPRCYHIDFYYV